MNRILSALPDFFSTPGGIAVLAVIAAVLALVIIELNYRLFMKSVLDFIFSLVAVVVLSPVFIITAIIVKRRVKAEGASVITLSACVGSKGKIIYVRSFSSLDSRIKYLPRLLDVLSGKLSIVGPKIMQASDAALIEDDAMERFSSRPGLISPLVIGGCSTYEEMFTKDVKYVKKRGFFRDIRIVAVYILHKIRGEGGDYLGEAANMSYAQALVARGAITEADAETARSYAEEAVRNSAPLKK